MPSLFLALYVAIFPYTAQSPQELSLSEGDVLYILDKSTEDDWWKAKKRMVGEEDDEPIGLVPNNYIEPMKVVAKARALYDYDRQTDEEVNIKEDEMLDVYDTSDPDWVLVGVRDEYGFAPSNYLEFVSEASALAAKNASAPPTPSVAATPQQYNFPVPQAEPASTPFGQQSYYSEPNGRQDNAYAAYRDPEPEAYNDEEESEEDEAPRLPTRPRATSAASHESISRKSGFLTWNVQEVDSKRKKYKATLAIGNGSILFSPERASSSPQQWSITNLINYNSEKKHVFLEFEHPSVSLDLHTGSKEVSAEIISAIGELAGAKNATGLREVIEASVPGGQKYGKALYDFDAQGDDEVTIREGDDVFILDDVKSDEWWMIRHSLSGKEGVVPSNYIEVIKKPPRSSSLPQEKPQRSKSQRKRRESTAESPPPSTPAKPRPDPNKIRTWTDVTGTFKVEAAFIGCTDGKIQLHKVNGVKIAVAASKMSAEDVEYVEHITGLSLRPKNDSSSKLGAVPTQSSDKKNANVQNTSRGGSDRPAFDWFEFFLSCGVDVNNCQRYAINFDKDQMDETILPDITPSVMRMLGMKEGDIIRVSKVVDEKYNKKKRTVSFGTASVMGSGAENGENESDEKSLFVGPDGSLKNNTKKSRPAPAVTTPGTVDGTLLSSTSNDSKSGRESPIKQQQQSRQTDSASDSLENVLGDLAGIAPLTPKTVTPPPAAPQVSAVSAPPALAPTFTGQQANLQTQYVALQPKLGFQPNAASQGFAMAQPVGPMGFQFNQPTGLVPAQQLSPLSQPPMMAFPTGQAAIQPGFQPQQPQMSPQHTQVFYGVQRPAPSIQMQNSGAFPAAPLSNGAFGVQPTGFQQQVPVGSGMGMQPTGFPAQMTGFPVQGQSQTGFALGAAPNALQPQPTRPFIPQSQFGIQQMQTGFQQGSVGGFQQSATNGFGNALQPQPTGFGFGNGTANANGNGVSSNGTGVNSVLMKPLQPTKTGPPPKVSFGVSKPLESTPTGIRKANLAAATAENPFGF